MRANMVDYAGMAEVWCDMDDVRFIHAVAIAWKSILCHRRGLPIGVSKYRSVPFSHESNFFVDPDYLPPVVDTH